MYGEREHGAEEKKKTLGKFAIFRRKSKHINIHNIRRVETLKAGRTEFFYCAANAYSNILVTLQKAANVVGNSRERRMLKGRLKPNGVKNVKKNK